MSELISDLPRKQPLLNHAVWDHDQAMRIVRRLVAEHLAD